MKLRRSLTIIAGLAAAVGYIFVSSLFSDLIYIHLFFDGDDLRDLTPGDGVGMLGLWAITLLLGWLALFFILRGVYPRIPRE